MKIKLLSIFILGLTPQAFADNTLNTWLDKQHHNTRQTLSSWAHRMDDWFGEPDPNQPASANLRLMLDTNWDKYDGVRVKPRVRGRVKLPVLERKLSVVFGDDDLDNEILDSNLNHLNSTTSHQHKRFDMTRTREDNSSIALRWSHLIQNLGVDTDADIGIRSGDDLYLRLKAAKTWQYGNDYSTTAEQMYRYGIDSKHFARSSVEVKKKQSDNQFAANYLHADYKHNDDEKRWEWGDSLYRQHHFSGNKRLNYGIQLGGALDNKGHHLNSYGVFATWRQPIWRDWLFVQTEVHYSNNRDEDRNHYPSTLLRLEAIF